MCSSSIIGMELKKNLLSSCLEMIQEKMKLGSN